MRIVGSEARPRVSIFRSANNIYVQAIDDEAGKTLASINSFKDGGKAGITVCSALGKHLGEQMLSKQISKIVFDKNGYAYHGRVKAFAEGMREAGLQF